MLKRAQLLDIARGHQALLTDGGLETTLIFHDGLELTDFAAFPLLNTPDGRAALARYYEHYLALAAKRSLPFLLGTPTWRANPDWARGQGLDNAGLVEVNAAAVRFLRALQAKWADRLPTILVDGVVGPRGDGYGPGMVSPDQAKRYHALQVGAFATAGVDLISAITMTSVGEAVGVARAAQRHGLAHVVSFTVETDGRLPDGMPLGLAIEQTDRLTDGSPAWYMVNCAHPTHFDEVLANGGAWLGRLGGLRANASRLSHAELDEATALDAGDPVELGAQYRALRQKVPALKVLGGCCGTDHRHVDAIATVWCDDRSAAAAA